MSDGDQASQASQASRALPKRQLRDPRALRAFAHPLRLRLFEELAFLGDATATELSDRVGESPASCSWHLRQLARYDFIEEADAVPGRSRPWRVVIESTSFGGPEADSDPELVRASESAEQVLMDRNIEAFRAWLTRMRTDTIAWRDAAFVGNAIGWLTADELAALRDELNEVMERHLLARVDRRDPTARPPGTRPIRLVQWAFPAGGEELETPLPDDGETDQSETTQNRTDR